VRSGDSPIGAACAAVVQEVRGFSGRVQVIDPVDGGPGSSLELMESIVDGKPLGAADVTAANRALSKP
jgi:hypothetical protein